MPSAMVGNNAVQSAIPEVGNGSKSDAMKQVLGVLDKKVRNMEKKKVLSRAPSFPFIMITIMSTTQHSTTRNTSMLEQSHLSKTVSV